MKWPSEARRGQSQFPPSPSSQLLFLSFSIHRLRSCLAHHFAPIIESRNRRARGLFQQAICSSLRQTRSIFDVTGPGWTLRDLWYMNSSGKLHYPRTVHCLFKNSWNSSHSKTFRISPWRLLIRLQLFPFVIFIRSYPFVFSSLHNKKLS